MKRPNLRHCGATHRTTDWANITGELAGCRPAHQPPETGRQAGADKLKGKSQPQRGILYQTASRLPLPNQDFLGFWMVDICWEGCSQRSAPQERHRGTCWHPGNRVAGTGEVIRCTPHLGRLKSPSTWSPELLGPAEGTKPRLNQV